MDALPLLPLQAPLPTLAAPAEALLANSLLPFVLPTLEAPLLDEVPIEEVPEEAVPDAGLLLMYLMDVRPSEPPSLTPAPLPLGEGSKSPLLLTEPRVTLPPTGEGGPKGRIGEQGTIPSSAPNASPTLEAPGFNLPTPAVATPAPVALTIAPPVHSPAWPEAFAESIVWTAEQDVQDAELHLTPKELGPIEVRLRVAEGTAQIVLAATQADTREAIHQSLPQLAQLMAQSGIVLGQVQVTGGSSNTSSTTQNPARPRKNEAAREEPAAVRSLSAFSRQGLVDHYA